MGARFRSVMPSDLFAPGAMAKASLPAKGPQYASEGTKKSLLELYRRSERPCLAGLAALLPIERIWRSRGVGRWGGGRH
jgi:hypothetical protein